MRCLVQWYAKIGMKKHLVQAWRMAYNISWKKHLTNKSLYGKLPLISTKIQLRRMRLAGHWARQVNRGRRQISYIDNLVNDTGVDYIKELNTIMSHRDNWNDRVYELERLKQVTTIVSK